jgi:hypothetical protein
MSMHAANELIAPSIVESFKRGLVDLQPDDIEVAAHGLPPVTSIKPSTSNSVKHWPS